MILFGQLNSHSYVSIKVSKFSKIVFWWQFHHQSRMASLNVGHLSVRKCLLETFGITNTSHKFSFGFTYDSENVLAYPLFVNIYCLCLTILLFQYFLTTPLSLFKIFHQTQSPSVCKL